MSSPKKKIDLEEVIEEIEKPRKKTVERNHTVRTKPKYKPEPEDVPETIFVEPEPVVIQTAVVCANCGLPKESFVKAFGGLRPDLQRQNGRKLCPRCFKPVEPY